LTLATRTASIGYVATTSFSICTTLSIWFVSETARSFLSEVIAISRRLRHAAASTEMSLADSRQAFHSRLFAGMRDSVMRKIITMTTTRRSVMCDPQLFVGQTDEWANQSASNRRPAGQSGGSGNSVFQACHNLGAPC
jgi:hypothetical protein